MLIGGGGGPSISVTETVFLSRALTVRVVLGGILGIALLQFALDGTPFSGNILAGASVALPIAGSTVTLTMAAGIYVLADYQGVV